MTSIITLPEELELRRRLVAIEALVAHPGHIELLPDIQSLAGKGTPKEEVFRAITQAVIALAESRKNDDDNLFIAVCTLVFIRTLLQDEPDGIQREAVAFLAKELDPSLSTEAERRND